MKITMSWARKAAVIAGMILATGDDGLAGDFIRIKETDKVAKLQTAVFGYEKDGVRVDLIGAIHLADARYYRFLNKYFENYGVVLFEMVGGEGFGRGKHPIVLENAGKDEDALSGLRVIYGSLERALGLAGQMAVVDYTKQNFVHADLTMKEFSDLQEEKGESLLSFMIQAGIAAERPKRTPDSIRLMRGILTGRADLVKLEMMHTMAEGDTQIDSLAGENVIIGERNAKALEVMENEIGKGEKEARDLLRGRPFPGHGTTVDRSGIQKSLHEMGDRVAGGEALRIRSAGWRRGFVSKGRQP